MNLWALNTFDSEWIESSKKLKLDKTEHLFMMGKDCPQMDLLVTIEDIEVAPSLTARNCGVVLDDQLSCNAKITSVAWSCRIPLNNNVHSIQPFLTREAAKILVQALVYCWTPCLRNQTLTLHPECSSAPRVQLTKVIRHLHWLPEFACIRF